MSTKKYFLIILTVVVGILMSFYSGFFLKDLLLKSSENNDISKASLKPYFEDEIILISKDKPHYTLIASATRYSTDYINYAHNQKILFFNGESWAIKASDTKSDSLDIAATETIPSWKVDIDPSYVLKQSVTGEAKVDDLRTLKFEVPLLNNEMGIRSNEGYTVFRSEATGKIILDGNEYESYVLYSRTYSYSSEINSIAVTEPLGINTDWVAFWDTDGNFYNIDKTYVDDRYKGEYKSHSIAVFKDINERVQKTFNVDIKKEQETGYQINLGDKINKSFSFKVLNSKSKNIRNQTNNWVTGHLEGEVKDEKGKIIKGFGLYEKIYQ